MEQQGNKELFEETPVPKAACKLMIPTVISSLVMIIYSLADTYFVGLLNNPEETAAVTLASTVLLAFNAVNNLFGVGTSSMMSRALGSKDYDVVSKSAVFGFYCSLISGLIFSLLCFVFKNPLLNILGADSETVYATSEYLKWTVIFGASPAILNVVLAFLVRAEGAAFHASIGTMSGCILNIILDPVFILPWGFNMGASGAGLATFISNCVACAYFIILLFVKRKNTFISLNPKKFCFRKNIVTGICSVGIPASIQNLLNVISMTILNNFTASYGADAVAAIGIAQKINLVPVQVAMGGGQGIMPLISYSYASGNNERFKSTIKFMAKIMLPSMIIVALICWINSDILISMFMEEEQIIKYGVVFLRGFSIAMPFLVADYMIVAVFQGIGMGKQSFVFAVLRKVIFEIPAVFALNYIFGYSGLTYSSAVAEVAMSFIGLYVLKKILNKIR